MISHVRSLGAHWIFDIQVACLILNASNAACRESTRKLNGTTLLNKALRGLLIRIISFTKRGGCDPGLFMAITGDIHNPTMVAEASMSLAV